MHDREQFLQCVVGVRDANCYMKGQSMPLELGIWRIDGHLARVAIGSLNNEERLEQSLDEDISIASPNWMVVG